MTATDPASWPTPRRLMKTGIARSDLRCATHPDRPWDGEDELSASCLCAECREVAGQARSVEHCRVVPTGVGVNRVVTSATSDANVVPTGVGVNRSSRRPASWFRCGPHGRGGEPSR